MNLFRTLNADEIDCRISQIKEYEGKPSGLTLLLYKDARCDQNILDESVGPYNWKREHTRDNRNCIVSLWDAEKQQWVSKEDTGTESNTEKEKGLASDSFKRACFNWGIGRELYTAPFVWIPASKCNIEKNKYGKLACYDNFRVTGIDYLDGSICFLTIKNEKTGKECFKWGERGKNAEEKPVAPDNEPEQTPNVTNANAEVKVSDKIPVDPVVNFMRNEIGDIQELLHLSSYEDARKQVFTWADSLIKGKSINPIDWQKITLDEAQNLFKAIRKTYKPGDAA